MDERFALGIGEAARALGISPWTVRLWLRQGKISPVRLGRRVLIEPAELRRLVAEARERTRPAPAK